MYIPNVHSYILCVTVHTLCEQLQTLFRKETYPRANLENFSGKAHKTGNLINKMTVKKFKTQYCVIFDTSSGHVHPCDWLTHKFEIPEISVFCF